MTREDANKLKRIMKERDNDNGCEPLNTIDRGYHLAYQHMCEEIDKLVVDNVADEDSISRKVRKVMQIVIDIPKEIYELCVTNDYFFCNETDTIRQAIKNGTPLPKGHGRLKDEDEIVKAIEDRVEFLRKNDAVFMRLRKDIDILGCIPKIRCEVPTIIEADKESEEKE